MINHIVFFKCKDKNDAVEIQRRLRTLPDKIEAIRYYDVGVNIVEADRNYDVALISKFDSLDDLARYSKDPVHLEFVEYVHTVTTSIIAVDYET